MINNRRSDPNLATNVTIPLLTVDLKRFFFPILVPEFGWKTLSRPGGEAAVGVGLSTAPQELLLFPFLPLLLIRPMAIDEAVTDANAARKRRDRGGVCLVFLSVRL